MNVINERRFEAGPLRSIFLVNGYLESNGVYGPMFRYEDIRGLYKAIFNAVISKPARLTGSELTYLRDRLDVFQATLGLLLGVTEQTVSLWERDGHIIPKAYDALIRKHCIDSFRAEVTKEVRALSIESLLKKASSQRSLQYVASFSDQWQICYRPEQIKFSAEKTIGEVVVTNIASVPESIQVFHKVTNFTKSILRCTREEIRNEGSGADSTPEPVLASHCSGEAYIVLEVKNQPIQDTAQKDKTNSAGHQKRRQTTNYPKMPSLESYYGKNESFH